MEYLNKYYDFLIGDPNSYPMNLGGLTCQALALFVSRLFWISIERRGDFMLELYYISTPTSLQLHFCRFETEIRTRLSQPYINPS
jgi:hypothetical protein